jgi:phosphodiesterase/alkaline phosphatase D-like protein
MKRKRNERKKQVGLISATIVVLALFTAMLGPTPVGAADTKLATVTRYLPDSVALNEQFTVTLTQIGFGFDDTGWVKEVLPPGFEYVSGSYTGGAPDRVTYDPATRTLRMPFVSETSITYAVKASSYTQIAVFTGTYKTLVFDGWQVEEGDVTGKTTVIVGVMDEIPPTAITNLATSNPTTSSIKLSWTAPGDDGTTGTATTYDIRYRVGAPITTANFAGSTQVIGEPAPKVAGSSETFTVTGLTPGITYYFAIKTADEVPNWSPISNSPSGTTTGLPDGTAPAAITNLATSNPKATTIDLTWTAPGDDGNTGTAAAYDIRYRVGTSVTEANWATATQVAGEPAPKVAGSSETFTVTGLNPTTTYYFAIKTADEVPNVSPISNSPSGTTLVSGDVTSPAAITNLATSNPKATTIDLSWTAPGDDGATGTAAAYDIRYRVGTSVTEANWATATQVAGEPTPKAAGSSETFTVTGLTPNTTYYFAIKTADEVPNVSPISNSPSGTTLVSGDVTSPAAITNLAASNPTTTTIDLSWTAPGDDGATGTAAAYDIRYLAGTAVTEANWATATQVAGEPTPKAAGSSETFTVTGLTPNTMYYFAIKTADEVPNISPISNSPSGTTTMAVICFEIDFATGYNMISMPVDDPAVVTASTLANKVGVSCTEIVRWDSATQSYVSYIPSVPLNNFAIEGGMGYLVNLNNPTPDVLFCNSGWTSPFAISLLTGYNMIGIPVNDSSVTSASTLAAKVGSDCTEVVSWDSATQSYVSFIPGVPLNNFATAGGAGYLVNVISPTIVTFTGTPWQN